MAAGLNFRDALAGLARLGPSVRAGRLSPGAALSLPYATLREGPSAPPRADAAEAAQYYLDELAAIATADLSRLPPRVAVQAVRDMAKAALAKAPEAARAVGTEAAADLSSLRGTVERLAGRLIPTHAFGQGEAAQGLAGPGDRLVAAGLARTPATPRTPRDLPAAARAEAGDREELVAQVREAAASGADLAPLATRADALLRTGNAARALRAIEIESVAAGRHDPEEAEALLRDRALSHAAGDALARFVRLHAAQGGDARAATLRIMDYAGETAERIRSSGPVDTFIPGR